jgi:hypothetical protein
MNKQSLKRNILLAMFFLPVFFLLQCQYANKAMKELNEPSAKKDRSSSSNAGIYKSSSSKANGSSGSNSEVKKVRKEAN